MNKQKLPQGWKEFEFLDSLEKEASNNKLKIKGKEFLAKGEFPIIDQGDNYIAGYTNNKNKIYSSQLPVVVFGDHTRAIKFVDFPFAFGADGIKVFVPKSKIDVKYFYYAFRNLKILSSGYSRHYKFLKERTIPLPILSNGTPDLKKQKQIIAILEKAEGLKDKLKGLDELFDEYFGSVFWEMFLKEKGKFEEVEIEKICLLKSGGTPSRQNKEFFQGNIPWITTVSLGKKYISKKDAVELITLEAIEKSATKLIPKNSILIGTRVGVGKTAINLCGICTSQDITSITNIDPRLKNEYMLFFLNYYSDYFKDQSRGATIQGITSSVLKSLKIPLPPITLQEKFASIVEQVEKIKIKLKNEKRDADELFNALMQKAFSGELV